MITNKSTLFRIKLCFLCFLRITECFPEGNVPKKIIIKLIRLTEIYKITENPSVSSITVLLVKLNTDPGGKILLMIIRVPLNLFMIE